MLTKTPHKSRVIQQENWEQQYNVVTHNDVIDAYLQGKKAGRNEMQIAMNKLFENNLTKAQDTSEELYRKFTDMNLTIHSIHLKADTVTSFNVLVITDLKDYVSKDFLKGITISRDIKAKSTDAGFEIDFLFTYHAETLNEKCLDSDGYFMKYHGNK